MARTSNGQTSTTRNFNRTAAPNINGSGYHPLDINKDATIGGTVTNNANSIFDVLTDKTLTVKLLVLSQQKQTSTYAKYGCLYTRINQRIKQ